MFTCANCGGVRRWIAASCMGCHKPLCAPCLNSSAYCKRCMDISEGKPEQPLGFEVNEDEITLYVTPGLGGTIIVGMYDSDEGQEMTLLLNNAQAKRLISWLQNHLISKGR